jgi:DEAD/DEAH box helicase domain-containing protein
MGPDLQLQGSDGCYRCIRSYHLQYRADRISRERGITLLGQLIEAGERREPQRELESIKPNTLFGSMLEKKFVDALQAFVHEHSGTWEPTLIRGNQGFRFALPGADRLWELELQPRLGQAQGVAVPSQPDFLLRCDEDRIKPIAIFTDGFQFHCHPVNRLADDMKKRRAILETGQYHVWNITWDDLDSPKADHVMVCHEPIAQMLQRRAHAARSQGQVVPAARRILCNGMEQLKAFIEVPHASGWTQLAVFTVYYPLQMLAAQRTVAAQALRAALDTWRCGQAMPALPAVDSSDWVYNDKAALNQDVVTYITVGDAVSNRQGQTIVLARLGDSETECMGSDYRERWRRFLAVLNLMQFCGNFCFWTSSEADHDEAPEIPLEAATALAEAWQAVLDEVMPSLQPYIHELAAAGLPVPESLPEVEHFNDHIDDDAFAELAWPWCQPPICILAGDQLDFSTRWQAQGWRVITPDDLQAKGMQHLIDQLANGRVGG